MSFSFLSGPSSITTHLIATKAIFKPIRCIGYVNALLTYLVHNINNSRSHLPLSRKTFKYPASVSDAKCLCRLSTTFKNRMSEELVVGHREYRKRKRKREIQKETDMRTCYVFISNIQRKHTVKCISGARLYSPNGSHRPRLFS